MEKKSRFELIKIVEAQKEQLGRYETRLRDVVHAYRNLLQEKEALEASVTVLTSGNNQLFNKQSTNSSKREVSEPADQTDGSEDKNSTASKEEEQLQSPSQEGETWKEGVIDHPLALEQSDSGKESSSQHEEGNETSNQANIAELQQKIVTLSASLSTVMQQKSKMEASYQADKKKMMQHHEAKLNEYQEEKEKLEKNVQTLEEQLQELKLRMRHEQQAREEELNNNVLMLRELQMLVSTERSAKEDLEQQLEDAKEQATVTKKSPSSKVEEYERQISQLQVELQGVQRRLKEAEKTSSQPSPLLVLLQEEMVKMKKEHADAVVREQKRANDAEERLRIITTLEECRVADLEVKLSELSEVVGNYEKLRLQDQQAIQKLKERLQQLDVENASLSRQISFDETLSPNNEKGMGEDETEEDLKQQVNKLKGFLRIALDSCDKPLELELERLSKSELESLIVSDPTHKVCQQELKQLKEEFERYKVKTQALHKNKSFKELSLQLEKLERLKTHNDELIRQVQELRDVSNEKEQDQGKVIANLRDKLKMMEENHKQEKEESNTIYKQKLEDLERQVLNQRERTLALVAEKDAEIEILRSRSPASSPSVQSGTAVPAFSYQRKFVELTAGSQAIFDSSQASEADTAVHQLLSKPSGATGSESSLVHYAQQQARREAESTAIRRHKNELEVALRDAEIREEKLCEQANVLKEEIRKLERDRSRESANLEYLKNIVLRFMMSTSYSVKQQMITAIATILQFSPKELNQVRKVQSATWWGT